VARLASLEPAALREMGLRGQRYATREFDRATLIARLETYLAGLHDAPRQTGPAAHDAVRPPRQAGEHEHDR
jgi:hypothetical protein